MRIFQNSLCLANSEYLKAFITHLRNINRRASSNSLVWMICLAVDMFCWIYGGYIWLVCWICLSCMDYILSRLERVKIHVFVLSQIIFFQGCCTRLTIESKHIFIFQGYIARFAIKSKYKYMARLVGSDFPEAIDDGEQP